eukprot:CAMPEP_0178694902 /NCGR_PEP_ID=MMETSP0699-20121125/8522_1 /TAXON_ID=265572 /ORGANISM="Extubocellulus spinifer, Strain CCMP396" /LENGTH=83 /DNA_ID=CAMNT_0020340469 /DNA_START=285 /DNA_END=536 /DNA_ORIENTATION=-
MALSVAPTKRKPEIVTSDRSPLMRKCMPCPLISHRPNSWHLMVTLRMLSMLIGGALGALTTLKGSKHLHSESSIRRMAPRRSS